MIILGYIPSIFMLVGLLMYGFCANPKLAEVGRMLFFAGALAFATGTGSFGLQVRH